MIGRWISMQVVLFNDDYVMKNMSRNLGKVKKSEMPKLSYTGEQLKRILGYEPHGREYESVLGYEYDNCYELELLGLFCSSRSYIIELDFSKRLDLVLATLTNCNPVDVRKIPNYEKVSKALLTVDVDNFDIPLLDLFNKSKEVDKFLFDIFCDVSEVEGLCNFLTSILGGLNNIISYVGSYLQSQCDMVMRSVGKASLIMTSNRNYSQDVNVIITDRNGEEHVLPIDVNVTKKKSYKELIDDEFVIVS